MVLKRNTINHNQGKIVEFRSHRDFAEEFTSYVKTDKEAVPTLEKLKGKYKLGIVSNFALPECARKLLERFQLKGFFDVIVISAEVNKRKPSPEIFKKAYPQ